MCVLLDLVVLQRTPILMSIDPNLFADRNFIWDSLGHLVHGLGKVVQVCRIDASERNAPVFGQIDVKLFRQSLNLHEGKHLSCT